MDELTRKALVKQVDNIITDYDERELSETGFDGLNRDQLSCISECLQFGQYKGRLHEVTIELENLKKCYMGTEDAVMKLMSFEDYIQEIIDNLK